MTMIIMIGMTRSHKLVVVVVVEYVRGFLEIEKPRDIITRSSSIEIHDQKA